MWINPYIAQRSPLFAEGKDRGYLLRSDRRLGVADDLWQAGMALVDFTNPDAREWYSGYLRELLATGVDCFKTDFGERIPSERGRTTTAPTPSGCTTTTRTCTTRRSSTRSSSERGEGEAVLFARSATAGGQTMPVHWGGDNDSTFASMAETLRGGLSLGLSGFGFWSHDIGGFEGTPDPAGLQAVARLRPALVPLAPARLRLGTGCRGRSTTRPWRSPAGSRS